jgi:hypothetical protein
MAKATRFSDPHRRSYLPSREGRAVYSSDICVCRMRDEVAIAWRSAVDNDWSQRFSLDFPNIKGEAISPFNCL